MGSRYLNGSVNPDICLLPPPPPTHYRMLPPHRSDFHVPQAYVPQPPNQTANQGPPLRSMAPTGPPTQTSTSPNADLKVQPHVQQQQQQQRAMIYQQRAPSYFQRAPQTNPAPRILNQPPPPQQAFLGHPTTQMMTYHNVVNVPTMSQNYVNQRAAPVYMQQNMQYFTPQMAFTTQHYPVNSSQFFYQRPQQAQVAPVAQGLTHTPPQAQPMAPAALQPMPKKPTKKRSNAILIINPETMRPIDDDESHPTSGDSSASQTPQPPPDIAKETQARFAKQVAQAISTDAVAADMEAIESQQHQQQQHQQQHHHSAIPDVTNVVMPPPQQQQLPPPLQQQQPQHPPAPFQQIPQNVHRNDLAKSSKLQVPTSDFVPANNNLSNTAKEPPVVSAISNAVEVTIPGKPKDRESPAKGRKSREPPTSSSLKDKEAVKESTVAPPAVKEVPAPVAATVNTAQPQQQPQQQQQTQEVSKSKEEKPHKEGSPVVQAAPELPSKAPVKETAPPACQAPMPREDNKKPQQQQHQHPHHQQAKKADGGVAPIEIASVNAPQPAAAFNQDNSGKSKQNQRGKEQQSKQAGGQQIGQNNKPPAPTAAANQQQLQQQQQQQPSKSNKANKMKELNMKGASKEGTDMDAFNMNVDLNNANTNSTEAAVQPPPAQSPPQQQQQQLPPPTPVSIEPVAPAKKIENNEATMTITKPEPTKPAPKRMMDVTDIVKDTPKPFTPPPSLPVVDNKDETDRAPISTDKIVQAKNEVNAKTAISNEQSEITPLQYKENQWSPHNQDGKRVYDRDFLIALRSYPQSKTKPEIIINEVVANDDRSKIGDIARCAGIGSRTDFTPSFGNYIGKSQSTRIAPKRNSQQGKLSGNSKGGGKSGSMIRVCISFKEDVKLHETENAWKPARLNPNGQTDDDRKTEDLYRKVRGVLNKLTPQKFSTLINQIKQLPIDSSERLQGVIDLVFEKAVDEPNFSMAYALMCRELALMQVPITADSKDYVNFRKLLVTRCQMEFEKNSSEESNRNERMKMIDKCTDPEKKKELMIQLEEDDRRIRQKSVGNIRFIGELFKQAMLTTNIMVRCLNNLIENEDEERLECLCKLLTTIGKDFEQKHKVDVSNIFDQMRNIVERKNGKVSSRVRFMLQDVIDLRSGGWVPRRTDLNPKTIDQIQKEADNEQMNIQMNTSQMTPRKDDRNSSSNSDRKRGGRNVPDDGGWSTATSRKNATFNVQSDKLKIQQPAVDEPLGNRQMFGNWQRGSGCKTGPPASGNNKYAPLEAVNDMDSRSFINSRHKEPYSSKSSSVERNYKTYDGRNSRSGSQHRTQDNSQRNTPTPTPPPQHKSPPPPVQPKTLTPEQLTRKILLIADEFIGDCAKLEETETDFRATIPPSAHVLFVSEIMTNKLERSSTARLKVGSLFNHLLQQQCLSLENYCSGLETMFSLAEDLIVDIPQIWVFYAEVITTTIISNMLPLANLHKCAKCLIQQRYSHRLLAAIFTLIIQEKGPNFLSSLWKSSGLSFADFMDAKLVDEFVSTNRLEFLTGSGANPVAGQTNLSYAQIYDKLNEFVVSKTSTDDVFQWITANVGDSEKEKEFIRVLTTVYIENSIVNDKLNDNMLRSHYTVFQRYISNNIDLELQCLFAIQSIVNKLCHPQGLLLKIFNTLFEDSIISHDCFLRWEKSEDPIAQENKGVAVKQLTSFFTQLKEVESENDSASSSED